MARPLFARTALGAAAAVFCAGALALAVPSAGATVPLVPTPSESTPMSDPPPGEDSPHEDSLGEDPSEDSSARTTLPAGDYDVRQPQEVDTFALYGGNGLFMPGDEGFEPTDIVITLPDIGGTERDFVLTEQSWLNIVTGSGPHGIEHAPYAPEAEGQGDRTFTFAVSEDGTIGDVNETTPGFEDEENDEEEEDRPDPPPTEDPTPPPSPDPTPTPTPEPTPSPTDEPDDEDSGSPQDPDGDQDSDDSESGDDGVGSDADSEGDGEDSDDDSSDSTPHDPDWVPTAPRQPDNSDPVPQPPGTERDDAITSEEQHAQAGIDESRDDSDDDVATDSASDNSDGAMIPWPLLVIVGMGVLAIGFILFMGTRRRS